MLKFNPLCLLEFLFQGHMPQETAARRQQQYISVSLRTLALIFFLFSISLSNQSCPETVTLLDMSLHISIRQNHRLLLKLTLGNDPFQYQLLLLKMLSALAVLLFYVSILYSYSFVLL